MIKDAIQAYAHYISIFLLISVFVGELLLFRKSMPAEIVKRLAVVDRWYGIAAGLVILTGLGRVFGGAKGAAFYAHSHVFWTKMLLFVIVALLSIYPTISFLRLTKRPMPDGTLVLGDGEYARLRNLMVIQAVLLLLIPLCAVFMARGL